MTKFSAKGGADADASVGTRSKRKSPLDQKMVRKVARAIWRSQPDFMNMNKEERTATWSDRCKTYAAQARKIIRTLELDGVTLAE